VPGAGRPGPREADVKSGWSNYPSTTNCPTIYRKVSTQNIGVYCQKRGQPVSDSGYSSEWWSYTYNGAEQPTGWVSNVFIRGKAHLDGVPDCAWW